ncbi:hypothetical protein D3C86_1698090 [compost metagenome]
MPVKPTPPPPTIPLDVLVRAAADLQALQMHLAIDSGKPVPAPLAMRLSATSGSLAFYAELATRSIAVKVTR